LLSRLLLVFMLVLLHLAGKKTQEKDFGKVFKLITPVYRPFPIITVFLYLASSVMLHLLEVEETGGLWIKLPTLLIAFAGTVGLRRRL